MSDEYKKIPYYFDTPIPRYFREHGFLKNPKMCAFLMWAFARCNYEKRTIYHVHSIVELDPFEFVFGRKACSEETGLTEMEVRGILHQLDGTKYLKILEKITSKTTNKFTVYRWSTDVFSINDNQQNNQQTTSRQPADNHKLEYKNKRIKKDPPLTPPLESKRDEDSFLPINEKLIEICHGIELTQSQIAECVAVRGDFQTVQFIVDEIISWRGRKFEITDWVTTINTWTIKNKIKDKIIKNEMFADKMDAKYSENPDGWTCRKYHDKRKDQKGLLFEGRGASVEPIFVDVSSCDFIDKVGKIIREKGMQKSREKQQQTC